MREGIDNSSIHKPNAYLSLNLESSNVRLEATILCWSKKEAGLPIIEMPTGLN
jgi:hypothetical protein